MGESSADAVAEAPATIEPIAVVHALSVERAGLVGADAELRVYQSGPGPERAAQAARAAIEAGARALVSWGLAGGLEPEVVPGTVVVPEHVVTENGPAAVADSAWQAALAAALEPDFAVSAGALLSTEHVLATPREKVRAALATGAVAVDLESAAIGLAAARAGLPFVAVRVVADGVADRLPTRVESWVADSGAQRVGSVVLAALSPASWSPLIRLAQRYRVAHAVLEALAEQLVPVVFARPGGAD